MISYAVTAGVILTAASVAASGSVDAAAVNVRWRNSEPERCSRAIRTWTCSVGFGEQLQSESDGRWRWTCSASECHERSRPERRLVRRTGCERISDPAAATKPVARDPDFAAKLPDEREGERGAGAVWSAGNGFVRPAE